MSEFYSDAPAGPLFDLARRTDPPTSHAAAARVPSFRPSHKNNILAALDAGPAGQTEIARRTGMTVARVSKRLCELRRELKIIADGEAMNDGGNLETVWKRVKL